MSNKLFDFTRAHKIHFKRLRRNRQGQAEVCLQITRIDGKSGLRAYKLPAVEQMLEASARVTGRCEKYISSSRAHEYASHTLEAKWKLKHHRKIQPILERARQRLTTFNTRSFVA